MYVCIYKTINTLSIYLFIYLFIFGRDLGKLSMYIFFLIISQTEYVYINYMQPHTLIKLDRQILRSL